MSDRRNDMLLCVDNVHKTYRLGRVDVPVLKGASLDVRQGEWVAVLGASGSGKSTLLHLMGDLDRPDAGRGTVVFAGQPVSTLSQRDRNNYRNRSIGFVFQFYHLLPELTVLENTLLPAHVDAARPGWRLWIGASLAASVGLVAAPWAVLHYGVELRALVRPDVPDWAYWGVLSVVAWVAAELGALSASGIVAACWIELRSLLGRFSPEYSACRERAVKLLDAFGLGHRLKHRPRELSGGERQRVAIARALMNQPKVLLADEPTGNLDETTGEEILDLIAEQHRDGLTIVMVTHDPAIARRADRLVRLHEGQIQDV